MIETIPVPGIDEYDSIYWENCKKGNLSIQHCGNCDEPRFPPRHMCPKCQSIIHDWKIVSGQGILWSFVIPRSPLLPFFEKQSPYVVGLVELNEYKGIRLIGQIINNSDSISDQIKDINIGDKLSVNFKKINNEISIPFWIKD